MKTFIITCLVLGLVSSALAACDKEKVKKGEANLKEALEIGKKECAKAGNEHLSKNLNEAQITWFLDTLNLLSKAILKSIPKPDEVNEDMVNKMAAKVAKNCKSKLTQFNLCSGDHKMVKECFKDELMDLYGQHASWMSENCNKMMDQMGNEELKKKAEEVMKAQMEKYPK